MSNSPVVFDELMTQDGHCIAIATLNAERSLNALTLPMVELLLPALKRWQDDPKVVLVMLRGQGERAFCAGGDVRSLTEFGRTGQGERFAAAEFFAREYRLDYLLHTYTKPVLVWGTGIVMGGGLGLFAAARYRIATETTRMAMPEITIGLYPDVGGSYFLSRLPGRLGLFLGLGAVSLNAADALALQLATHVLGQDAWSALCDVLSRLDWQHPEATQALERALDGLRLNTLPDSAVMQHAAAIERWCDYGRLEDLDAIWRTELPREAWLAKAVQSYRAGSPTSAALIWRQWHEAKTQTLAQVFHQEWIVSTQCSLHGDFPEGVRALLIDKDQQPRWQPASLAALSVAHLDAHYAVPAGITHPLDDLLQR